jgi:hypothetical protein
MKTTENYDQLLQQIDVFIRKYYFNTILKGVIFLGAWLFSAYLIIAVSEYFGNFNTQFRTFLFYFFILLNLFIFYSLIIPSLLAIFKLRKSLSREEASAIIGKQLTTINDKLLNTLQLKSLIENNPEHQAIIEASINQKITFLKPLSFKNAINLKDNLKYLKWAAFPLLILLIIVLVAPAVLTESTKRLIKHNEFFEPIAPFKFVVENQDLSVLQGDDFKLRLKLEGNNLPENVYIETNQNAFKLDKANLTHFYYLFNNQQQNIRFKLLANGYTSKYYEIKVKTKPVLLHFDVALTYPHYLHKKAEIINNAGDLTIPEGSTVKWLLHTQNANQLLFSINGNKTVLGEAGTDLFQFEKRILANSVFSLIPVNEQTIRSDSATYKINIVPDEAPIISVSEKPDSISMNALYFNGNIQDDHGFTSLTFHYQIREPGTNKKADKPALSIPVNANLGQTTAGFFYYWNTKSLGLKGGEQVSYFFEVADNDGVNGPKKARTPVKTINIPDAKTLDNVLNAGTQAVRQKIESAIKIAAQLERETQKLNQNLLNKSSLTFDEKKQVEDLLQKRTELNDLVKEVQNENKKNLYNRLENQHIEDGLKEKQQQIDDLLSNVLDPKTNELIQKLQALLEQEQKESTRDELSKMQTDNKSLKKELDRMLELYKKLAFEQKLDEKINQIDQLSEEQQKIADEAKNPTSKIQSLQKEQQKANSDFNSLKNSLKDLQRENEQNGKKQDFENPEMEMQSIEQKMQNSSEDLSKNKPTKAAKQQQEAANELKQLAQKLKQNEQEGEEAENLVNARELRELLKNLVNSSFEQEKVMLALKGISTADPNYIALAQSQKNIKDNLKTAEDSLTALSKRVTQIQTTVNKEINGINSNIDLALENLGERHTPEANRYQQTAMTSMNNLALMLNEVLDKLQNQMNKGKAGKGKGKQQSISQLAKMQQKLNENMQKAREQMQQSGNSQKGQSENKNSVNSEQLAKLAREQQQIREALQKINKEDNKDGRGKLGNLDKISQQMEQNERDIVNRKINGESIKRQEEIKTRLLEAEKAEQERDQDQKRESSAGKDLPPGYINALKQFEVNKNTQTEQVKTIPLNLNLYYKTKIKSYFDFLKIK